MTPSMVVVSSLRPPNTIEQPNQASQFCLRRSPRYWRSLYFLDGFQKLTTTVGCMLTSAHQECVPVAQWIEHLPCWSLNGEGRYEKNSLSGRPHMRERPESLRYSSIELRVTIREDWVIRRKPPLNKTKGGFLRDYTGRDCDV